MCANISLRWATARRDSEGHPSMQGMSTHDVVSTVTRYVFMELVLCYFAGICRKHAPLNCLFAFADAITASANTLSVPHPAPRALRRTRNQRDVNICRFQQTGVAGPDDKLIKTVNAYTYCFSVKTKHGCLVEYKTIRLISYNPGASILQWMRKCKYSTIRIR